ncbi:hypothetical protein ACQB60_33855 [Actinomycetota bacterium Odt1-20B]
MAKWGLVVETTTGSGERKYPTGFVIGHVEGTREDALAELERHALVYQPEHPRSPKRRRLYRHGDGFLLLIDGVLQDFSTRLTVAELIQDSADPRIAAPLADPGPEDAVPQATDPQAPDLDAQARYDDGVPVRPSWWGRSDLS